MFSSRDYPLLRGLEALKASKGLQTKERKDGIYYCRECCCLVAYGVDTCESCRRSLDQEEKMPSEEEEDGV